MSLIAKKPLSSKVLLRTNADFLEIFIPPAGFSNYLTVVLIVMEIILSLIIAMLAYGTYWATFPYKIILVLFSFPWVGAAILLARLFFQVFFECTRLYIDQQKISLVRELFCFPTDITPPSQRQDISKLEYIERKLEKDSESSELTLVYPHIIIWAGEQKYNLDRVDLSEPDLDWLASELSSWLGLPIDKV